MAICWSCKKKNISAKENRCFGCGHIVCVDCAMSYGHEFNGWHGSRPTKRAAERLKAGAKKSQSKADKSVRAAR